MAYPVDQGLAHPEEGSYVYVNRGAGAWGPPIRFLAPTEITIIDIAPGSIERATRSDKQIKDNIDL